MSPFSSELGKLVDPHQLTEAIELSGFASEDVRAFLRTMYLIRQAEEQIAKFVESGDARCPCHLAVGQEAVAVGVSKHLTAADRVFGGHRSHAHFLALGPSVKSLFAEVLGRYAGCSHGMGGSMHLFAPEFGFHGSVPIVGASLPVAAGAALAAKKDGGDSIAVAYLGDGTTEEGVFHESLNLAATFELPLLVVCENNLYSSHLDIRLRQPTDRVSRYAEAHKCKSLSIDGNDVCAVARAAEDLISHSRNRRGPAFLEAVTYRWKGHVGPREDIDVGIRRSVSDVESWKQRDPIQRALTAAVDARFITLAEWDEVKAAVDTEISAAASWALEQPYPDPKLLLEAVYG